MYRFPALAFFILIQIGLMGLGLITNPILTIGVPIIGLITTWLIYNPGASLLLLLLTGIIKGFIVNTIPVFEIIDYTLLFTILVWIGLFRLYFIGQLNMPNWGKSIVIIYVLFCIMLFFSGFYTPSPIFGWQKIMRFAVFNSTLFITPLIIVKNINDSQKLLKWFRNIFVIVGAITIGYVLYFLAISNMVSFLIRFSIFGANPIAFASLIAVIAGMIIVSLIHKNIKNWLIYLPILVFLLLTIIMTGSRGPIVSLILGSLIYLLIFDRHYKNRIVMLVAVMIVSVLLIFILLPDNFTSRFLNYTTGDLVIQRDGVKSVSTLAMRWVYWKLSISEWLKSFRTIVVGIGAGGFSSLYILRDYRAYPHNMFIEILLEFGLIGFSLIMLLFSKIGQLLIRNVKYSEVSMYWTIAALISFFAGQFSGNIADHRNMWMFLSLALVSSNISFNNMQHGDDSNIK